jgi:hypothetical protein
MANSACQGITSLKFKFLIIGFNILIILFLLVIGLSPLLILGVDFALKFWVSGWPIAFVLLAALCVLNVFFLHNRRLFLLLEKEDWPALVDYLERKIYDRGSLSPRLVKLLANSYILLSDASGVQRLEKRAAVKPSLLDANTLVFGAARILSGDSSGAASFFGSRLGKGKPKNPQWVRWFYGFSMLLSRDFAKAEIEFKALAINSDNAIITGLSSWFLAESLSKFSVKPDDCLDIAEKGRSRLRRRYKKSGDWEKEAARIEVEVHAAIIKKYIDQCTDWLFKMT